MAQESASTPTYLRISDLIRKDIFSGAFLPGQRLKVLDLAGRYATSQMPVREAFHILQGEGLVEVLPNRGAVVLGDQREVPVRPLRHAGGNREASRRNGGGLRHPGASCADPKGSGQVPKGG